MERQLSPGSIATAVGALRFFYTVTLKKNWKVEEVIPAPKIPNTLPVILSPEEVTRFLESVKNVKHRTVLTTCYAVASVNNLLRKVMVHNVQQWSEQRSETQKGFLAQMRLRDDLYVSPIGRHHPYGNL